VNLTENDWRLALYDSGVRAPTAARFAPAMAREFDPSLFSQGMDDVLDLLPQVLHETAMLERLEENLSYSAKRLVAVWPSRFPDELAAARYAYNPQALAEVVYGGRMGNTKPGWAWLYRGQGPMFTGRDAYELLEKLSEERGLYQDFTVQPWLVQEPAFGLHATRLWWEHRIPDGMLSDQVQIRRRVNGGRIGLEHCMQLADSCRRAFA
jgi:putative chitinase